MYPITIDHLTKSYRGHVVVDDLTFTVSARQGHRVPRPERRREVDHHEGAARPGGCRQGNRHHR